MELQLGIVITAGGGPDHRSIGFQYWRSPGPFVQYDGISGVLGRFLGYWAVLTQAAFSYIGTEIVAIAAGEAKNPRRNLPRAIKRVYIRILIFYLVSLSLSMESHSFVLMADVGWYIHYRSSCPFQR